MKIHIGCDHAAFGAKEAVKLLLEQEGHEIVDVGTHSEDSCDYPDFALALFEARAHVERAPAARLAGWVDMPWCPADLYFIRKLSLVLDAAAGGQ